MSSTESTLQHHLQAFGDRDVDEIMADYADDAVVITETETYHGREAIRGLFEALTDEFDDPSTMFGLDQQVVEDDIAYIVWHAETPENEYEFATDTFVIRGGEIHVQTLGTVTSETG